MTTRTTLVGAACLAMTAVVAAANPAHAGADDFFVVDTQFTSAPHQIIDAGGVFADCTTVRDLGGTAAETGRNRLVFEGAKRVRCSGGTFTLEYTAATAGNAQTIGSWTITASTLAGAPVGSGGTLRGDYSTCTPVDACITDTFVMIG